jgi:hypothetical protein
VILYGLLFANIPRLVVSLTDIGTRRRKAFCFDFEPLFLNEVFKSKKGG